MTTSSGQQTQQTSSKSSPWAPTQPELQSLIGQIGAQNTGVTGQQAQAQQAYANAAGGLPNFSGATTNLANSLLSGIPNLNQNLQGAYGQLRGSLGQLANPNNLNPLNTPGLSNALNYEQQQIQNSINGQFAGAGRDLSPANTQALAYGETGALAPLIMGQYNTNVGNLQNAANSLFGGAGALNSALLGNAGAGVQTAGAQQNLALAPALAQLAAANQGYNLPFANIGTAEGLTLPIAGLGGQTQSQGQTNTSFTPSPLASFGSFFGGGLNSPYSGALGAAQGFGSALNALPFLGL